jgi:predicted ATPase
VLLEWTIGNFKSIAEPITLKLAPLTVLVGANSSGKSSVLQSILAVMQTLVSPTADRPLVLNGQYLKLGSVIDILHYGSEKEAVEFAFRLRIDPDLLPIAPAAIGPTDVQTEAGADRQASVRVRCRPVLSAGEPPRLLLQSTFMALGDARIGVERNWQTKSTGSATRQGDGDTYGISELAYPLGSDRPLAKRDDLRAKIEHFLPQFISEPYDVTSGQLDDALSLCEQHLPQREVPRWVINKLSNLSLDSRAGLEFRASFREVFGTRMRSKPESQGYELGWHLLQTSRTAGEWLQKAVEQLSASTRIQVVRDLRLERPMAVRRLRESRNYNMEIGFRDRPLPEPLGTVRNAAVNYFTEKVWYLGPLRDNPRAIYDLPPVPEDLDVGLRGEFTASVLQHHQADKVTCPIPGDPQFQTEETSLGEAVRRWLVHMELVEEVITSDRGKIGTELSLHLSDVNRNLDLTNVGIGVSQVLPSIVMGLLAPAGSTLLMEQPELHLHPKVQSQLGDFLIGLAKTGRQCVVETHSEYLINRLRRRIAEAPGDSVQKVMQIYFVERSQGQSVFRPVEPNEYGAIPDWPKGFFDQGPDEAQLIIQAATKKRQAKLQSTIAKKER